MWMRLQRLAFPFLGSFICDKCKWRGFNKGVGASLSLDGSDRQLVVGGDRFGWFLMEKVGGDKRLIVAEDGQVAVGVG